MVFVNWQKCVFWAWVAQWWASVSSSAQGFQVFSVWSLTMFPTRFSVLPPQSTDIHNRFICDYKMHTGVNVSVTGCLFLHVSPVIRLVTCPGCNPYPSPSISWDLLQSPVTLQISAVQLRDDFSFLYFSTFHLALLIILQLNLFSTAYKSNLQRNCTIQEVLLTETRWEMTPH